MLLFPAAVLAVLVLAAVTLDLGLAHLRAQQLRVVAASAANDAVGALDSDRLRSSGTVSLDHAEAQRLVRASVLGGPLPDAIVESVQIRPNSNGHQEVAVTLRLNVRLTIAPALPGANPSLTIRATERSLAVISPG